MGTPHQGSSSVQMGKLLVNVASLFVAADNRLLKHLEKDSEWLEQQLGHYGPISGDFVTKFAYEEYKTPTAMGHSILVNPFVTFCHGATDTNRAGRSTGISSCAWRGRCRADRHPCRPRQHGQVLIKREQRIPNCIGAFAHYGQERL